MFCATLNPRADDSVEEPESSRVPTFDEVATMQLDEFAHAGLVVRVAARRLGCDLLLVSDDVPEDELRDRGLPVYRAAELRKLAILKPNPRNLRLLHDVKAIFNGTVGSISDP